MQNLVHPSQSMGYTFTGFRRYQIDFLPGVLRYVYDRIWVQIFCCKFVPVRWFFCDKCPLLIAIETLLCYYNYYQERALSCISSIVFVYYCVFNDYMSVLQKTEAYTGRKLKLRIFQVRPINNVSVWEKQKSDYVCHNNFMQNIH